MPHQAKITNILSPSLDNSPNLEEMPAQQAPAFQLKASDAVPPSEPPAANPNNTGLPDHLKSGIESLSGFSMDDVRVHVNSEKPTQLQAHAYAQGRDIHLGPGQEKYLPHEAWHVVQQKQGRVKPTVQMKGGAQVNDDAGLEREADVMGERAQNGQFPGGAKPVHDLGAVKQALPPIQGAFATFEEVEAANNSEHFIKENRKFNASPELKSKDNPAEGTVDTGLGAKYKLPGDSKDEDLKSEISWKACKKDDESLSEGTYMKAFIGPDHKRGSTPGSSGDWVKRREKLEKKAKKQRYIAGHLLNHNLGGPGNIPENLAAIPADINSKHSSKIEETVKKDVNEDHKWGTYTVQIEHGEDSDDKPKQKLVYASKLTATWTPEGLVKSKTDDPQKDEYKREKGDKTTLKLNIPAPSKYEKGEKAADVQAMVEKHKHEDFKVVATPLQYDQLVLTDKTNSIVQYGIANIRLIKKLEESNHINDDAIKQFKKTIQEYEKKIEALNSENEKLRSEVEEHEANEFLNVRRLQIEKELNKSLTDQIEQLKKENSQIKQESRDRAQTMGNLTVKAGEDPEPFTRGMSQPSQEKFNLGRNEARAQTGGGGQTPSENETSYHPGREENKRAKGGRGRSPSPAKPERGSKAKVKITQDSSPFKGQTGSIQMPVANCDGKGSKLIVEIDGTGQWIAVNEGDFEKIQ